MKEQDLLRKTTGRLRLPAAIQQTRQDTLAPTATRPINLATATAAVPTATAWQPHVQWKAGLVKRVGSLVSR